MRELAANHQRTSSGTKPRILGVSSWAVQMRREIERVAPHASTVLITGPTGTGKELIARCLHAQSPRSGMPFVPVDCAAISGPLCASQLFGHVKGAFTGADYESLGCFRAAEGGTIFLDEVGELDPQIQAMLLRTLQERSVIPVGSPHGLPVNVRIVAATNRPLDDEVRAHRFRLDLLFRLRVVSLQTVRLCERPEDIPILAEHHLTRLADDEGIPAKRLAAEALAQLRAHHWPGNVRELQNVLERAAVFSDSHLIGSESLQIYMTPRAEHYESPRMTSRDDELSAQDSSDWRSSAGPSESQRLDGAHAWPTLSQQEAKHIARTLELTGYNQSAAARLLDIDRHMLARKMKKYGLEKPRGTL